MSDDLLSRATRALRESDDDAPPPPVLETRHRVLATLRQKRASRVVWLRRVLPIAAVLVTSSAWAAANGHLGGALREVAAYVGLADPREPETPAEAPARAPSGSPSIAAAAPAHAPSEPALVEPPAVASAAPIEAPAVDEGAETTSAKSPPVASASSRAGAQPAASAARGATPATPTSSATPTAPARPTPAAMPAPAASADDPAQALYSAAHQKHFAERDYAGALAAWETYLRAAPGGRFAAEAHYNRAICLVRLGRSSEARTALQAFADGGYGGYRQSEAKALLEALQSP